MIEMFKGVANSPETTITNNINESDTIIYVLDETRIPNELPNLMVLGTGTSAETVKVLSIEGNAITVERGFQGVPRSWNAGTIIARNFTEYDYNALVENVKNVDARVGPLASLISRIKTSIVNAINGLQEDVDEHKADFASLLAGGNAISAILESGWGGTVQYSKNDLGQVHVRGSLSTIGTLTSGTRVLQLPTGYRPKQIGGVPCYVGTPNVVALTGLYLHSNGGMFISKSLTDLNPTGTIFFDILFQS